MVDFLFPHIDRFEDVEAVGKLECVFETVELFKQCQ
jgi:hypothetical protein